MPTPNIVAKNGGRRFYSLSLSKLCSALGEGGFSVLALLFPGTFCNQVQVSSALKSRAMVMTPSLRTTRLEPCPPSCAFPLWQPGSTCVDLCVPNSIISSSFCPAVANIAGLIRPAGKREWPVVSHPAWWRSADSGAGLQAALLCSALPGPHPSCAPPGLSVAGVTTLPTDKWQGGKGSCHFCF